MQIKKVFEKKYKSQKKVLENCAERRVTDLLIPVIPEADVINSCLAEVLQKRGVKLDVNLLNSVHYPSEVNLNASTYIPPVNNNFSLPTLLLVC